MSVVDRNVIDFGHEDKVTICISDHIPWDSEIIRAHLEVLHNYVQLLGWGHLDQSGNLKAKYI